MSPERVDERPNDLGFPRVSGDEPHTERSTHMFPPFSPRERG